jgi:hypothetical protein
MMEGSEHGGWCSRGWRQALGVGEDVTGTGNWG